MSDTYQNELTSKRPHRKNEYGLCHCGRCKGGRHQGRGAYFLQKVKNKIRNWKSNKEPIKGVYTD